MPQQQPIPIHIRIDTQEQRSGIPDLLVAMPQVHIEVTPLLMGDYDIGGSPCRVLERKTGSDFLGSLAQGRLFAQLTALQKSRLAPILLLEGDPLCVGHSQMRPESIRGALTYITAILRVPILPEPRTSGVCTPGLCCCDAVPVWAHGSQPCSSRSCGRTAPGYSIRAADADPVVPARHRPVTARAICARFRSLYDLLSADAAQLSSVPGISSVRAAALEQLLRAAMPAPHGSNT